MIYYDMIVSEDMLFVMGGLYCEWYGCDLYGNMFIEIFCLVVILVFYFKLMFIYDKVLLFMLLVEDNSL